MMRNKIERGEKNEAPGVSQQEIKRVPRLECFQPKRRGMSMDLVPKNGKTDVRYERSETSQTLKVFCTLLPSFLFSQRQSDFLPTRSNRSRPFDGPSDFPGLSAAVKSRFQFVWDVIPLFEFAILPAASSPSVSCGKPHYG